MAARAEPADLPLPGPDTPLEELTEQARQNPFFAEFVGYALWEEGRTDEARTWFERGFTYADSVRAVEGVGDDAAFAGYLVRMAWLARGSEAALAVADAMPDDLRRFSELASPICFVHHGEPGWWVETFWLGKTVEETGPSRGIRRVSPTETVQEETPLDSCLSAI